METLEEVLGSSMCRYSSIEKRLAILYRNQVKIYDAINKEQKDYSEEEVIKFGQYLTEFNNLNNESEYIIKKLLEKFKNK